MYYKFVRLKYIQYCILVLLSVSFFEANAQGISGVINTYQKVNHYDFCRNSLQVDNSNGFYVGDKVLLIQMKGAIVDTSNSVASGTITNYANAGHYEFAFIDSIYNNELFLRDSVQRTYNDSGALQVIRVPVYNNAIITDTIKCIPWNGSFGGIVVLEDTGILNFNAPIDVRSAGFKGGRKFVVNGVCRTTPPSFARPSTIQFIKGEGIAYMSNNTQGGIGCVANGGGAGGSQQESAGLNEAWYMGGGGGSNYAAGGRGGKSSTFCGIHWEGGVGGRPLLYNNTENRIFMAGGGGFGHHRYNTTGPDAATNGGGIVIIKAKTLSANGYEILANALDVPYEYSNVGRSGGGAGGTVLLDVESLNGILNVNVKGGRGGDNSGSNKVGPGGGGSGGLVWINQPSFPPNLSVNTDGGSSGRHTSTNDPWGATPGITGGVLTNLELVQSSDKEFFPVPTTTTVSSNSPLCEGDSLKLYSGLVPPSMLYQWTGPNGFYSNDKDPAIPNASLSYNGDYQLEIIVDGCPGPANKTNVYIGAFPSQPISTHDSVCFGAANPLLTVQGNVIRWYSDPLLNNLLMADTSYLPVVSSSGIHSFYVTETDSLCESVPSISTLTIHSTPDAPSAPSVTICEGNVTPPFIADANGPVLWYSDSLLTTLLANNDTLYPSVTLPGTYFFYAQAFDTLISCTTKVLKTSLTILPLPYAIASQDTAICTGHTVNLSVDYNEAQSSTIFWSNGATTKDISVAPVNDTIFYVEVSIGCATAIDSVRIIVHQPPIVTTSSDTTVCYGEQANLIASGGMQYLWSHNAGVTPSVVVYPTTTTTYAVTVTDANNCSNSSDMTVYVVPFPIAQAGNDTGVCEGLNTQLTASGGSSYFWSTGQSINTILVQPVSDTWYRVTVTDTNMCSSIDSVLVSVWPLPVAFAGADTGLCQGFSANLNASGGSYYQWSPTTYLSNSTIANPLVTPTATTTYTVIVSDNHGCSTSDNVLVELFSLPVVHTANDTLICVGAQAVLSASGGLSYQWSHNAGNFNSVVVSPSTTTTYAVTVTDTNNCTQTNEMTVSVVANPLADAGANTGMCWGNTTQLTASGGMHYQWSTGQALNTIDVFPVSDTWYKVTVTDLNQCSSTDSVLVAVWPLPIADAGNDTGMCDGFSVQLMATGGLNYFWSPAASLNNSLLQNPVASPSITTTYYLTVTDSHSCSATDDVVIQIFEQPTVVTANDTAVCQGSQATLSAFGGTHYVWSHNAGQSSSVVVAPPVTTTYNVTVTDNNSCVNTGTMTVSVLPKPIANAGNDTSICLGATASLFASGGTLYNWSSGQQTQSIQQQPIIDTWYRVTVTDSYTCTATDSVFVTVWPLPLAYAGTDTALCQGASATLSASGGLGYQWSPVTNLSNPFIATPVATPTITTTYVVTVTSTQGCSATDEVIVGMHTPSVILTCNDTLICEGGQATLSAYGGVSFDWSNNAGNTSVVVVNPSIQTTYTVTVTDANSCAGTGAVTVSISQLPFADAGANTGICAGEATLLTANGGLFFEWSTGDYQQSVTVQPSTDSWYRVTVTDNNMCSASDSVFVQVWPLPIVDAGQDVNLCVGFSDTLNASGGTTYHWSPPTGLSNVNIPNPVVTPITNTTYSVFVNDINGCAASDSLVVGVYSFPNITITGDTVVCLGDTVNLTASGAALYQWSHNGGSNATASYIPQMTTTYKVTVADNYACNNTDSFTVHVFYPPFANAGEDTSVCEGGSIQLHASGGGTYLWSTGDSTQSINLHPSTSGFFHVTVTDSYGCSANDFLFIQVNPKPQANAGNDISICSGASDTLSASGGLHYQWSPAAFLNNNYLQNPIVTVTSTTTFYLTVTSFNGCSATDSVVVSVKPIPQVDFVATPLLVCPSDTVFFIPTGNDILFWEWHFGDGNSIENQSFEQFPFHVYHNEGLFNVSLIAENSEGCLASVSSNNLIQVYPPPVASFYGIQSSFPDSESMIAFTDNSTGAVSWFWNFSDPMSGNYNTSSLQNPYHTFSADGVFEVFLVAFSAMGCSDTTSDYFSILPGEDYYIPKGFSPNNDGLNDIFYIYGNTLQVLESQIFNRWGELVYHSSSTNEIWNGNILTSNKQAPIGTYTYLIKIRVKDNKPEIIKGFVNIVR